MNIFYKVFLLAFDINLYLTNEKEENKMRIVRFIAKHWVISFIVVAVLFGVVLLNLEALAISMGSSLIQFLLGGK